MYDTKNNNVQHGLKICKKILRVCRLDPPPTLKKRVKIKKMRRSSVFLFVLPLLPDFALEYRVMIICYIKVLSYNDI